MCRYEDAPSPTFFQETWPKAAKPHRCLECGRVIKKGETHRAVHGKWEDRFDSFRVCAHCDAAREWLTVVCGGSVFGEVLEELVEHWEYEDFRSIPFGRLIVGMKHRWHDGTDPVPTGIHELATAMLAVPTR